LFVERVSPLVVDPVEKQPGGLHRIPRLCCHGNRGERPAPILEEWLGLRGVRQQRCDRRFHQRQAAHKIRVF
jgi:hypothetical protein